MIWNEEIECLDRPSLGQLQSARLRRIVSYVQAKCPLYRDRLAASRISPDSIQSMGDIRRLPFTVKEDMRDTYPFGLFSSPVKDIREIHVEVDERIFSDEIKRLRELEAKVKREVESILGINVRVVLVEPKKIERSIGKAQRVIDKRVL